MASPERRARTLNRSRLVCSRLGATGEAREKGLYDAARDFSLRTSRAISIPSAKLCGAFHWEDGGAEWLHAARRGSVRLNSSISSEGTNNSSVGIAGQLARRVAEKLKLRQEVFVAELQLDPVYGAMYAAKEARRYEPLPRFPSVERDFSLLLADGTKFAT